MKTKLLVTVVLLTASFTIAWVSGPFRGWDSIKEDSSDIFIADCLRPTPSAERGSIFNGPDFDSEIFVYSVLKGTNFVSRARLESEHEVRQGEAYLVFGHYDSGIYKAYDAYRVVSLGARFSMDELLNSITNKPLDEQIQILLKRGIDSLDQKIQACQSEKQRLEEGIKK